jgi:hypothetical protein
MGRAKLQGAVRRVKWVGDKQQAVCDRGVFGEEQGCLPSAVGMAAEEHPGVSGRHRIERADGIPQSFPVLRGLSGKGRSVRALLPVGKVTAKYGESGAREDAGQGHQQGRFAVGARAVRKRQGIVRGYSRAV